ncbi:hypothetical protein ACQJBY_038033 [Aegilops geniculata]
MSPQLAFADPKRFFVCASLSAGEDLLAYLSMVHERESNPGKHVRLSVTDRAAIQACEIAEELDASKDSPDMAMWPISKVAVLLLDPTRKKCLIEYSANTKGIWSIIEKEIDATDATAGNSHSTNQPAGQESTGMKGSNLRLLDETLAYSLSKERTTTKLFIVEYEQTMEGNLVEMCLEELISSMTGPLFANDPFPKTTSVVEYYHILPYKEILFELLHRKWPSDSPLNEQSHRHGKGSLHSVIDENVEEQDVNSTSKMQKRSTKVSTPKQSKQAIAANSNQYYRTSKLKRNSKRKSEASRADVCAEGPDAEIHTIENGPPPVIIDLETSKPLTKSRNTKAAAAASRETKILQAVDKNKTQKQSRRDNVPQDVFPAEAPHVDLMKNRALEHQNMDVSEKSGGTTEYTNDQIYDSLQSIQKIRDEIELDEICRGGNWIFPRYTVVPSVSDGMFHASVRLTCPEFEMSITGGPRLTAHEARCSAAANMILELHKKAEEEEQ